MRGLLAAAYLMPAVAQAAPHTAHLTTVAVSPDGQAALSLDALGSLRLWPRLDGGAEPVPLPIRGARSLRLRSDRPGWRLAVVDGSGGARLFHADAAGALSALGATPVDEITLSVELLPRGRFLALAADHTLRLFSDDGRELDRLEQRGFQATSLAASADGSRAVLVDAGLGVMLPVSVGAGLTARAPVSAHSTLFAVALSPDGGELAYSELAEGNPDNDLVLVDLASRKERILPPPPDARQLGYLGPRTIAAGNELIDLDGGKPIFVDQSGWLAQSAPAATGAGVQLLSDGSWLAVVDARGRTRFLGYRDFGGDVELPPGRAPADTRVEVAGGLVTAVRAADQARLWTAAVPVDVSEVAWTADGLLIRSPGGSVLLDAKTGAVRRRFCGTLARLETPPPFDEQRPRPSICDE